MAMTHFQLGQFRAWDMLASCVLALAFAASAQAKEGNPPTHVAVGTSLEQATDLRAQPLSLLAKFPEGGVPMANFVTNVITNDPTLAGPIVSVVNDASPQQASAIGAGLARGARALEAKHPAQARAIANTVMQSSNLRVKITFQAIGPSNTADANANPDNRITPKPLGDTSKVADASEFEGRQLTAEQRKAIAEYKGSDYTSTDITKLSSRQTAGAEEDAYVRSPNASNDLTEFEKQDLIIQHGTVIAIVASDAVRNGAVSTSPTR